MMHVTISALKAWWQQASDGWNQFWFRPGLPHSLAIIRIGCGLMLAYMHLIWLLRQADFLGPNAWIDRGTSQMLHENDWAWSWLWYTDNPWLTGLHESLALVAAVLMAAGLFTRVVVPVVWLLTLMTCHRLTFALFGLDQIAMMLAMYLMIADSGAVWSLDRRFNRGESSGKWWQPVSGLSTRNSLATRLIQVHLCVIYLFGGLGKMRGEMWYEGSALWFTLVNYEYQSMDLTFLGRSPLLIAMLSAGTIFWETFYCALVWPKLTRPLALGVAFFVHAGIALGLGMITFGLIMILANFAFIDPEWVHKVTGRRQE